MVERGMALRPCVAFVLDGFNHLIEFFQGKRFQQFGILYISFVLFPKQVAPYQPSCGFVFLHADKPGKRVIPDVYFCSGNQSPEG